MTNDDWIEESGSGLTALRPAFLPDGLLVAYSSRGLAPETETSPTEWLARGFARSLGRPGLPLVRATQVHGRHAALIDEPPPAGEVRDAGEADVLATPRSGVGLVVQTADCAAILLAGARAVAAAHAGWRGSAAGAARAAVEALRELGEEPSALRAWVGPMIRSCCYEVGGEVAARFAGDFVRRGCGGSFTLDLPAVNRAQLEEAGVESGAIAIHPVCTKCGGERYASYRRDGGRAGRMIALIARG